MWDAAGVVAPDQSFSGRSSVVYASDPDLDLQHPGDFVGRMHLKHSKCRLEVSALLLRLGKARGLPILRGRRASLRNGGLLRLLL